MKKHQQPATPGAAKVRQMATARQLFNLEGPCIARSLKFYREAEELFFVKDNPYRGPLTHLCSWHSAEW